MAARGKQPPFKIYYLFVLAEPGGRLWTTQHGLLTPVPVRGSRPPSVCGAEAVAGSGDPHSQRDGGTCPDSQPLFSILPSAALLQVLGGGCVECASCYRNLSCFHRRGNFTPRPPPRERLQGDPFSLAPLLPPCWSQAEVPVGKLRHEAEWLLSRNAMKCSWQGQIPFRKGACLLSCVLLLPRDTAR